MYIQENSKYEMNNLGKTMNESQETVSIVIPTYNQEKFIAQAIESALSQDYNNLEVIISDDNSSDSTEEIVKTYHTNKKLKYFKNPINFGRVGNYYKALYEYAKGSYVLNLDGDDFLVDSSYIYKAMNLMIPNNLIMVFAKAKTLVKDVLIEDKVNSDLPNIIDGNWLFLNYYRGYSIPHLSTLYNRSYAMKIGFYQENILSVDWESILRLMLNNRVGFINEYVGVWRKHTNNESKICNLEQRLSNIKFIESPYLYASCSNPFDQKVLVVWRKRMLKRYFFQLIVTFLILDDKNNINKIFAYIKTQYGEFYYEILLDIRLMAFRLLSKNKRIVHWGFKNILKQESFFIDLLSSQKNCN